MQNNSNYNKTRLRESVAAKKNMRSQLGNYDNIDSISIDDMMNIIVIKMLSTNKTIKGLDSM